jgi:hypothetical protein
MAVHEHWLEGKRVQGAGRDVNATALHPALTWEGPALSDRSVALGGAPMEPRRQS